MRMHRAFCFHFTAARQGSSMASVPVFCRDFWAERKNPGRGRTILNALRVALRIISGNFILNFAFVALCGALQTHFHGRGRNGKRHLPQARQKKAPEGGCSPGNDVDIIRSWGS